MALVAGSCSVSLSWSIFVFNWHGFQYISYFQLSVVCCGHDIWGNLDIYLPSLKLTARTWKLMVWLEYYIDSFWGPADSSGATATLVLGRVRKYCSTIIANIEKRHKPPRQGSSKEEIYYKKSHYSFGQIYRSVNWGLCDVVLLHPDFLPVLWLQTFPPSHFCFGHQGDSARWRSTGFESGTGFLPDAILLGVKSRPRTTCWYHRFLSRKTRKPCFLESFGGV